MYADEITRLSDAEEWQRLFTRQRGDPDLTSREKEQLDQDIQDVETRIKELS